MMVSSGCNNTSKTVSQDGIFDITNVSPGTVKNDNCNITSQGWTGGKL